MKTSFLLILWAAALSALSCQTLDDTMIEGRHRFEHYSGRALPARGEDSSGPDCKFDTIIRFSAVNVPAGYDWHRDTACGNAEAELIIYENFLPVLKISAGERFLVSTDPDTHHWLDGNLYTEYTTSSETVIKRNGEELFRYKGREFLKGLLIDGDGLWTLGQNKDEGGFSLRCNGETVLKKSEGVVFGNLNLDPHGGLYRDCGKNCFCYRTESDGMFHSVIGDREQSFTPPSEFVNDMLVHNGETWILYSEKPDGQHYFTQGTYTLSMTLPAGYFLSEAHMFVESGRINVLCYVKSGFKDIVLTWINPGFIEYGVCDALFLFPESGSGDYVLTDEKGTTVNVKSKRFSFEPSYLFTRQCFVPLGLTFCFAFNPREGVSGPRIVCDGKEHPVDINGFITGIDVEIKQF